MAEAPLTGLKVLDFSWGMPGGLATLVLSDFGADVTKVEPPAGDPSRDHPAWPAWNRGKKGIVLDLKTEQGRDDATRLAGGADVLLEAFRPGVATRLGIGYDALKELNPGLVYCSISGFGQTGPLANVKGYEGVVAARAGRMMTFEDQVPRPGPVYAAVPVASWAAGQAAVHGILAALRMRERTGTGQWVRTSLLQGTIPYDIQGFMVRQFVRMFPDKYDGDPIVNLRRVATLQYLPVRCKDGRWLQLANNNFRLFQSTIRAMGLWHIYRDERFKNAPDLTPENREALREIILERMQEKALDEWMQLFIDDGDVAAEPFLDAEEGMNHAQFQHNGHAVRVGDMTQLGLLAHLSDTPGAVRGPAPGLGEHTDEVLRSSRPRSVSLSPRERARVRARPPLDGTIVLEFATVIAGPYATSLLADLGARVVKVEPPGGDLMRQLSGGLGGGAVKTTAGKESIELDMKAPEGLAVVRKLIAHADVLLHNFRPGVPERLGIDYAAAGALNPRLIYVYAAGYGSTGPHSQRPAFHPLPGALFGGVLRQAGDGTPPPRDQKLSLDEVREVSRRLFRANEANPDPNTSMAITTAILLALHARERTGRGQEVETSMLMANAYANADEAYWYEGRPPTAMPDAGCFGLDPWYRLYQAREGWVFLACPFEDERKAFCRVAGQDLPTEQLFLERTAGEWEALLTAADLACVRADRTVAEFFDEDPHPRANGLVVQAEHQRFGAYERYGPLVTFSDAETRHGPGVLRGQHTRPLLAELGYTLEEIEDYLARGVVFQELTEAVP